MATIGTTSPPRATADMEKPMKWSASLSSYKASIGADGVKNHGVVDVALRALLFVFCLAAIIVVVTSKQSKMIPIAPGMAISVDATWNQSPAYIYYLTAVSVTCLYSIITGASLFLARKKTEGNFTKLQFHVVILDSLLLGILSSAVGAALAVAYIGLKGNSHSRWMKFCNVYGSFCENLSVSLTMSVISIIILLLLVWLSFYTFRRKLQGDSLVDSQNITFNVSV